MRHVLAAVAPATRRKNLIGRVTEIKRGSKRIHIR